MKVLVLDNYDSFTYNLVQYLGQMGAKVEVFRNDAIAVEEVVRRSYHRIVISPGPGVPSRAGISLPLIQAMAGKVPILGVCLGHQAIGEVFGGRVVRAREIFHGKTSDIFHDGKTLFKDLPSPFTATRYHSLILEESCIPDCLEISAKTHDGVVMGVRHRRLAVEGVQFHPESILTAEGFHLLSNFLGEV